MCNAGSDNPDDNQTLYKGNNNEDKSSCEKAAKELLRQRHETVMRVSKDFERNNFNTAISAIMELTNTAVAFLQCASPELRSSCDDLKKFSDEIAATLVKLIAPIAPHMAEEL